MSHQSLQVAELSHFFKHEKPVSGACFHWQEHDATWHGAWLAEVKAVVSLHWQRVGLDEFEGPFQACDSTLKAKMLLLLLS